MNPFFSVINSISYEKKPYNLLSIEEKNSINQYMLHRYISMEPSYIEICNFIQSIPNLSNEMVYDIYCRMLPKFKKFFKYNKSNSSKSDNDNIKKISSILNCSFREAKDYLKLINLDDLEDTLKMYGEGNTSNSKRNSRKKSKRD